MEQTYDRQVNDLAADIRCGPKLAFDLLTLAGGDVQLVRDASERSIGVDMMKAYIIDHRFRKIED